LVDEGDFFLRGEFAHGAGPGADGVDGVDVGAAFHRSDEDVGGTAAARLREDNGLKVVAGSV
jgi:hypothetical protein